MLWHIDLHGGNIFLDSNKQKPSFSGVIDWQSVSVLPLYMQATTAKFVDYTGENVIVEPGLVHPRLRIPRALADLPPEERDPLEMELIKANLFKLYEMKTKRYHPWSYAVHTYPFIQHVRTSIQRASRTWYEGSDYLRECLFQIVQRWDEIAPGVPLPVKVEQAEWERHKVAYARRERYDARVQELRRELGLDPDGWVANEKYEDAKAKNERLMMAWDEQMEGGPYPFQDGAPAWFFGS